MDFVGKLDHPELLGWLHAADAVVLPSRYEPFGIAALEAAAAGAPLVVATAGGLAEAVVDGETGLAFLPADVAGLTSAIRETLDDPVAAQQRAVAARARLGAEFDWGVVAAETVLVYEAAKRRVRHPLGRPDIPKRPLPERDPKS